MANKIRVLIEADGRVYESTLDRSTKKTREFGDETRKTSANVSHFKTALTGVAGVLATMKLLEFARDTVRVGMAFEGINRTLATVTGSSQAAGDEMNFVRQEADRLGLQLESTARDYASLMASSRGTTLEGQATRDIFSAIAEASAILGLEAEQTSGALTAVEQIISKGNVSAEELRGQLGERLPGAFQMAARAMGVTTGQLDKMLVKGELTAEELLPALAREMRRTFGTDTNTRIEDTRSQMNRLSTAVTDTQLAINEAGFAGLIAEIMTDMAESLRGSREDIVNWGDTFMSVFAFTADAAKAATGTTATLFESFGTTLGAGAAQSMAFVRGEFKEGMAIGDAWLEDQRRIWGDLANNSDFDRYREKLAELRKQLKENAGVDAGEDSDGTGTKLGGGGEEDPREKAIDKMRLELALMSERTRLGKLNAEIEAGVYEKFEENHFRRMRALAAEMDAEEKRQELIKNFQDLQEQIIEDTTSAIERERQRYEEELRLLEEAEQKKLEAIVSYQELRERSKQRHEQNLREIAEDNARKELEEIEKQLGDIAFAARDAFKELEDAMVEAARTGKFEMRDMVEAILADLARLAIQENITKPLYDAALPVLQGIFSGGDTTTAAGGHYGAVIGHEATTRHQVDPRVFDGAPRHHRGTGNLGSNEVPFIGLKGEGVFTEEQMKRLAPVDAAAGPPLTVQIFQQGGQPAEVERTRQTQGPNGEQLYQIWLSQFGRDLGTNGSAARMMQTTFPGLKRGGAAR